MGISIIRQKHRISNALRYLKENRTDSRLYNLSVSTPQAADILQSLSQTRVVKTPKLVIPATNSITGQIRWNLIPSFTLPAHRELIFQGAGRNQLIATGRDLFDVGFTHIDETRMYNENQQAHPIEIYNNGNPPNNWTSPIPKTKRTFNLSSSYYTQGGIDIQWAQDMSRWAEVFYEASGVRNLGVATRALDGLWVKFGQTNEFPYDWLLCDVENIGQGIESYFQEHANLWVHLVKTAKGIVPKFMTLEPQAYQAFNNPQLSHYTNRPLGTTPGIWNTPAVMTTSSQNRGMPSQNVGLAVKDIVDYDSAHNYLTLQELLPNGTYTKVVWNNGVGTASGNVVIDHYTYDANNPSKSQNYLATLLAVQEVNRIAAPTKHRMPWIWLFSQNNESVNVAKRYPNGSSYIEHINVFPDYPASAQFAEGIALFNFMTGIKAAVLWDDAHDLTAGAGVAPVVNNSFNNAYNGQDSHRYYHNYDHFMAGLWRMFHNHKHVLDGNEIYLNENTEVSYDGGNSWLKSNALEIKNRGANCPVVRQVVNLASTRKRTLVVAQVPYAEAGAQNVVRVRYKTNDINWEDTIVCEGSEVYFGEAIMA